MSIRKADRPHPQDFFTGGRLGEKGLKAAAGLALMIMAGGTPSFVSTRQVHDMAILRWSRSRGSMLVHERMGRMFDEALAFLNMDIRTQAPWILQCDIYETRTHFVLKAEASGVELKDIILEIKDNTLTIAGERKRTGGVGAENYHQVERNFGRFVRSFTLPSVVEEGQVTAALKDGVLRVILPKSAPQEPSRVVEIQVEE